ncbi:hypothetical protein HNQ77_000181 [Silvibacterium bohemicum]|uniref:Outer membrane protein beta-barrel domain-containing protein n=1 Tax=Silvibacterium bohemicum TaxID=1577686 RepID=A0A841JLZ0_9BACT|nr:hypothetical protein [Silvibacterium bohemicum]MBB6142243.1 hypothetical protein [Silvibacterium bohemicum]
MASLRAVFALIFLAAFAAYSQAQSVSSAAMLADSSPSPVSFSSSRTGVDAIAGVPASGSSGSAGGITRGQPAPSSTGMGAFSRIAIGEYSSPLGIGVGVAAPVTRSTNLRLGWNFFNYSLTGTDDGANYAGHLHFRSLQASADWFPFHGSFHVSPGLLFNNQNRVTAQGGIAGGTSFTLNDVNYYSDNADPVFGSGSVHFKSVAPMFTAGWGNWVSRREHKHLTFPFEAGFAYTGEATVKLNLQGSVCNDPGNLYCGQIATDPSVQANINGQIAKLQKDLQWIRFYPIISGGVVYKF